VAVSNDGAFHAVVRGRVQGVGFRFFVQRRAADLGLRGWVRNLEGRESVEVFAEGPEPDLETLVSDLRRGPSMALVETVEVDWRPAEGHSGFEVRS
jgi:acylphosphatase